MVRFDLRDRSQIWFDIFLAGIVGAVEFRGDMMRREGGVSFDVQRTPHGDEGVSA